MRDPVLRHVRPDDAAALLALTNDVEAHDGGYDYLGADDVAQLLRNPNVDLATDWWVAEAEGRLVASTRLVPRNPVEDHQDVYVAGMTLPSWRGRGLGTTLLERIVPAARAKVAGRAEELGRPLRPVLRGLAAARDPEAGALLRAHGFAADRWDVLMVADLADLPPDDPELPAGYTVSTWEELDTEELRVANNRAFDGQLPGFVPFDEAQWARTVTDHPSYRPSLSLLVRGPEGDVASYVHAMENRTPDGIGVGFVGNIGTTPEHRRRGLGTVVLALALRGFAEAGLQRATLDADSENPSGAVRIYERAGFREVQRWETYVLDPRDGGATP